MLCITYADILNIIFILQHYMWQQVMCKSWFQDVASCHRCRCLQSCKEAAAEEFELHHAAKHGLQDVVRALLEGQAWRLPLPWLGDHGVAGFVFLLDVGSVVPFLRLVPL